MKNETYASETTSTQSDVSESGPSFYLLPWWMETPDPQLLPLPTFEDGVPGQILLS